MISIFCLPFDALTKHTFSARLPKPQGRWEWVMPCHCPLSFLPSMILSTGYTPQHVIGHSAQPAATPNISRYRPTAELSVHSSDLSGTMPMLELDPGE